MIKRVRLYLVRHGHVQYFDEEQRPINPKYAPLSERGRGQIRMLAQQLAEEVQFDRIYSSTMPRSIETANLIAKLQHKKHIVSFDEIREIKAGRLKDIQAEHAEHIIAKAYHLKQYQLMQFLNGESWQDFRARVLPCMEKIILNHENQTILVSAHDAVNRLMLAWVNGQHEHDLHSYEQHYGGLNIIDVFIEAGQIIEKRILLQNYTAYNPFKLNQHTNAVEDVYQMYVKTQGFQESLT